MSQFSDACKALIKNKNTTVYRMSKEFDLDWTTLQRMVSGKRLPNQGFVQRFCDSLQLTESESREILEYYKMEQLGRNTYFNRRHIRQFCQYLCSLEQGQSERWDAAADAEMLCHSMSPAAEDALCRLLEENFTSADPSSLYTNLPAENSSLFHHLYHLCQRYERTLPITHLFSFLIDSYHSLANLSALMHVLPITYASGLSYYSYYVYTRADKSELCSLLFPYYLISDAGVLLFSSDFSCTALLKEKAAIRQYQEGFLRILKQAHPLIQKEGDALSRTLLTTMIPVDPNVYCITSIPPFDFEERPMEGRPKTLYFTQSGLDRHCADLCAAVASDAMDDDEKGQLRQRVASLQEQTAFMLTDTLPFPAHFRFEIHNAAGLRIRCDLPHLPSLVIHESSICEAFRDFAAALKEESDVCSESETKAYVARKQKELSERLTAKYAFGQ